MAGVEWIKLYTNIVDHPKINSLRRLDNGNEIVFVWIMLLALAGRCNSDGRIFVTDGVPYSLAGLAYDLRLDKDFLADALEAMENRGMISTGVKEFPLLELTINNWEKYQNVEGLERVREQTRKRTADYRERKRHRDATSDATVTSRDATDKDIEKEKDIEIDNNKRRVSKAGFEAVLSEFVISEQLKEVLRDFIQQRKLSKKPMTDKALKLLINKLRSLAQDEPTQIAIVNQAIEHGWLSVYPLKADARQGANGVKLSNEADHTLDGIL